MKKYATAILFIVLCIPHCNNYGMLEKLENPGGVVRKVFVASTITSGSFSAYGGGNYISCTTGGIARADCACVIMAAQAGLANSNHFAAWLSNQTNDARCRVQGKAGTSCSADETGSRWVDTYGNTVAMSYSLLISGSLGTPIQYTESGIPMFGTPILTGTSSQGVRTPNDCSNYTAAANITQGSSGNPTAAWTDNGSVSCPTGATASIYCFETPTVPAAPLP